MKFKWVTFLIFLGVLSVLLALGNWQLNRAEEKRTFLKLQADRVNSEPMAIQPDMDNDLEQWRYRKATVSGSYDKTHQILLDNQIVSGKPGYYVFTPYKLANSNQAILVNRGWVPLDKNRNVLPDIALSENPPQLLGRINGFPSVGIRLAGAEKVGDSWPARVQVIDPGYLATVLGYSVFGFQLELDKDQPDGYARDWHLNTVMLPDQHVAYALQWFGLALALTIIFLWYSFKHNNDHTN